MTRLLIVPAVLMALTGCAAVAFLPLGPPQAILYADAGGGRLVTENAIGKKKGEACATSILGLVTTGDASIRAAADAGGITKIASVDANFTNILGIYSKYCTTVSGDKSEAAAPEPSE